MVIHGLLVEAGRWDRNTGGLCDANYGELLLKTLTPVIV